MLSPDERRALEKLLGHRFTNVELLDNAVRHRSAGGRNNERLEFLGDAVLGFIVAESLYNRFPDHSEGQLTRLRASLVRGEKLAELARQLDLGPFLRLGPGELKSGGRDRASILADTVEALFGAIYLDAGSDACRRVILAVYGEQLSQVSPHILKDPKTRLQEYLQGRGLPLPEYELRSVEGESPRQAFHVGCRSTVVAQPILASGPSRRKAEQAAAVRMLELLENL